MDQVEVQVVDQVVEVFKEEVVEEDPLLVVQVVEVLAVVVVLEDQEVQAQEDQVDQAQEDQVDQCLKTLTQLLLVFILLVLGYSMLLMVITWMLSNKKPDLLIYASRMLHLLDNSTITPGLHA